VIKVNFEIQKVSQMTKRKELGTTVLALSIIFILSIFLFIGLIFSGNIKISNINTFFKFKNIPNTIINDINTMQSAMDYKEKLNCKDFLILLSDSSYRCKKVKDKISINNNNLIFYSIDKSMVLNTSLSKKPTREEYDLSIYYKGAKKHDNSYNHEINEELKTKLKKNFPAITNRDIRVNQFDAYFTIYNFSNKIRN